MKKFLIVAVVLLTSTASAFSQFNFRLTYGTFNSKMATFGYTAGKLAPYVGLDVFSLGIKLEGEAAFISGEGGTDKVKASIIAPTIGARLYFLEAGKLKGYGNLSLQYAFIGGSVDMDGQKGKLSDVLNKKGIFHGQLAFGAEYFFDKNLSLIAEYGVRYMNAKFEGNPDYTGEWKASITPSATFAKIGLGFHF